MSNSLSVVKSDRGLSIGQVLELLADEFTGLSPSKLRFLEEQGLIEPNRSKSGYRKFSQAHIERLRLILTLQREHYLPLKVIAEFLEDLDDGLDPQIPGDFGDRASTILAPKAVIDRTELVRRAACSTQFLGEVVSAGLLPAHEVFTEDEAREFEAIVTMAKMGVTPQHLRGLKTSCERDAQLVAHASRARTSSANALHAQDEALQLVALISTIREGMLRRILQSESE